MERINKPNALDARSITPTQEASFWSMVKMTFVGKACWLWQGKQLIGRGYGRFKIGKSRFTATRVSYALAYGHVPDDMFVCHRCDNPLCVRPDHLFLGSANDNMKDRNEKGRTAKGSRSGTAILDEVKVMEILGDSRAQSEIAKAYGVSKSTIGKIKSGVNWAHIERKNVKPNGKALVLMK